MPARVWGCPITAMWVYRLGAERAKHMLFTGDRITGREAEAMGVMNTRRLAALFDGITRHSPEGLHFKDRAESVGWEQAVSERDSGSRDWTADGRWPGNR